MPSAPPLPVSAWSGAACSRICSRTAHNYLDGAGQNITIRTLARTTRPQVKPVLAGQGAYWQRVTCPTFNPAGRVRDPGGPQAKAQVKGLFGCFDERRSPLGGDKLGTVR